LSSRSSCCVLSLATSCSVARNVLFCRSSCPVLSLVILSRRRRIPAKPAAQTTLKVSTGDWLPS
jgi:hypothetical protein